jgi:hypothetical protein
MNSYSEWTPATSGIPQVSCWSIVTLCCIAYAYSVESSVCQLKGLCIYRDEIVITTYQTSFQALACRQSLLRLLILRQWPIVFAGAFSNPNAVRDCPFKLKGAWFLSRSLSSEKPNKISNIITSSPYWIKSIYKGTPPESMICQQCSIFIRSTWNNIFFIKER